MTTKLKAGEYWVGDLCYVMHGEWTEVCGTAFKDDTPVKFLKNGVPFSIQRTACGDGSYTDNHQNDYCVDSGTLGCIETKNITDHPRNDLYLGHVHEFESDFEVKIHNGRIRFGDVVFIDTDSEDDE